MSNTKLLIVFDPDFYGSNSRCIPLMIPKKIDPEIEYKQMLDHYPPNHCTESFDHWLRHHCDATVTKIDIFDTNLGRLRHDSDE